MKCLVTGGGGFIGSAIVAKLIKNGRQVVAMGRFERPHYISSRIINDVEIVIGDVRNQDAVETAARNCDHIYHFAGIVDSDAATGLSLDAIETEILGLRNICQCALKENNCKVIFGSSCAVYGDDKLTNALSEKSPVQPKSHYAVLKRMGELLLKSYGDKHGLNHLIFRIFNPYGINQPKNMAMHRFFKAALNNSPFQIYGAGDQTRDFIYIDDVATAMTVAAEKVASSEILNVCMGQDKSIRTVAETIISMTQSTSECEFLTIPSGRAEGELLRSLGSIKKLYAMTGFVPNIGLEQGLKLMYEDMISETNIA
jgi:UDP-glucose 4-epimerase